MKIGIGITTYNRPECLAECIECIRTYTRGYYTIYVAEDTDINRKGIAYRKNECLIALSDCDHVFLFDDDCFPIKDGWVDFFIYSGHKHLLYLNKYLHGNPIEHTYYLEFKNCGGVFMYMTKQAIQKAGLFDEDYGIYGFEHADYSNRIFGVKNRYIMLYDTEQYLFSHDYSTPGHKSSISNEEKQKHIKNNWDKYFTK